LVECELSCHEISLVRLKPDTTYALARVKPEATYEDSIRIAYDRLGH